MRDTVVRPLKRPLKGRREVEALIGERKYHTFDVWIVIFSLLISYLDIQVNPLRTCI